MKLSLKEKRCNNREGGAKYDAAIVPRFALSPCKNAVPHSGVLWAIEIDLSHLLVVHESILVRSRGPILGRICYAQVDSLSIGSCGYITDVHLMRCGC